MRSWAAHEEWLALPDFSNHLHAPPYSVLLNCDSWQVRQTGALVERHGRIWCGLETARPNRTLPGPWLMP